MYHFITGDYVCLATNCSDLDPPLNGAIACAGWAYGQMCQMQCNENWDIPSSNTGHYVCSTNDGFWGPADMLPVPDCSSKV